MPETMSMVVDRVILDRKLRDVKFYLRKNTYKKHVSNLSETQVKDIVSAIRKSGKKGAENLLFEDDVFILSPSTKRQVK